MITGNDFVRMIYEDDDGYKVKLGGKTEVELDAQAAEVNTKDTAPVDSSGQGKKIDFPQQRGPTNPVEKRLADMWNDSLERKRCFQAAAFSAAGT